MGHEKIIDLIPFGHDNAISRNELRIKAGVSDRKMRRMIENESTAEHPILNLQDGKGYFQPTKEDIAVVRMCRAQEFDRAQKVFRRANDIDKYYKTLTGAVKTKTKQSKETAGQINIFNYMEGII